jgi:hypothetical protein
MNVGPGVSTRSRSSFDHVLFFSFCSLFRPAQYKRDSGLYHAAGYMLAPADFDGYYGLGVAATADASTIFVSFNQSSGAPDVGFIAYSANLPAVVSAAVNLLQGAL